MSAHTHCPRTHLCAWTHSHSKHQRCQNKGTAANALVQSCKHRLAHYKQVWVPHHSAGLALSLGHTHTHTHQEGEFVPVPSSLVYFWGDKKMIKAMWPDSRNDLLTVSGVSYYTHANTHTFMYTVKLLHTQAHNFFLWLNTLTIVSWHSQKWICNISALYLCHIGVCTPRPSSKPSPRLGCR